MLNGTFSSPTGSANLTVGANQTIEGTGTFSAQFGTLNNGTVIADGGQLTFLGSLTNNGNLQAAANSTLLLSGSLTNFSNGTLTGGSWNVASSGILTLTGNITTNAATITLDGANASFTSLAGLALNQANLTITNGATFSTAANFTNTGNLTIGTSSTFSAPSTPSQRRYPRRHRHHHRPGPRRVLPPRHPPRFPRLSHPRHAHCPIPLHPPQHHPRLQPPHPRHRLHPQHQRPTPHLHLQRPHPQWRHSPNHLRPTGPASLGYYQVIQYAGPLAGSASSLTLPTSTDPRTLYSLDTTRDPNFIDLHIGFLGDANDDGKVDPMTSTPSSTTSAPPNSNWTSGNFDNAPTIDLSDLNDVLNNLGTTLLSSSFSTQNSPFTIPSAPEPASLPSRASRVGPDCSSQTLIFPSPFLISKASSCGTAAIYLNHANSVISSFLQSSSKRPKFRKWSNAMISHRRPFHLVSSSLLMLVAQQTASFATNGSWTNPNGGLWSSSSNWLSGSIAIGTDALADFSTINLTADATVALDSARSVGVLKFGDTTPSNNWSLTNDFNPANILTLSTSAGTPDIIVNNGVATISAALAGTQGLVINGPGALTLSGANTYTGNTTINANATVIASWSAGGTFAPLKGNIIDNGALTLSRTQRRRFHRRHPRQRHHHHHRRRRLPQPRLPRRRRRSPLQSKRSHRQHRPQPLQKRPDHRAPQRRRRHHQQHRRRCRHRRPHHRQQQSQRHLQRHHRQQRLRSHPTHQSRQRHPDPHRGQHLRRRHHRQRRHLLQLGDGSSTNGSIVGGVTINANATLAFANPNAQTFAGSIIGVGTILKTDAPETYPLTGSSTVFGGTINVNGGTLTIAGQTDAIAINVGASGIAGQSASLVVPATGDLEDPANPLVIGAAANSSTQVIVHHRRHPAAQFYPTHQTPHRHHELHRQRENPAGRYHQRRHPHHRLQLSHRLGRGHHPKRRNLDRHLRLSVPLKRPHHHHRPEFSLPRAGQRHLPPGCLRQSFLRRIDDCQWIH